MNLQFSDHAWEDYLYWQHTDKTLLKRINRLIEEVWRDPFHGIGKPEPLRHALAGYWSRRITDEHRMIYKHDGETLKIAALRHHY